MRHALLALLALCTLTACDSTQSLKDLRAAVPAGDQYQTNLAVLYQQYSESALAAYDWDTSEYFADKGLTAAYGGKVQPEDPADWEIPATLLPEFTEARTRLLAVLEETRATQPAFSANATVAYDRWVVAQSNLSDAGRNEKERTAFAESLAKLQEVQVAQPGTDAPSSELALHSPAPEPLGETPVAAPRKPAPTTTILYFPFDSDTLGTTASSAIGDLAKSIHATGEKAVTINGHTDRAGTEQYNMNLSERRARYVLKALAAAGVPEKTMQFFAFGESDPAVPTADGVREPKNRRVEILAE